MGEAYSDDLRQRILRGADRGLPVRQVSALFGVSTSFIYKALIRRRTTGETGARGGRVAKKLVGYHEALLERVRLHARHHAERTSRMAAQNLWCLEQHRWVVEHA